MTQERLIHVGNVEGEVAKLVIERSGTTQVRTIESTREHWRTKHAEEYDIPRAEETMADVVANPLRVYQGVKRNTLVFVEDFTETTFLVIPIKCLVDELWVGTMFANNKREFESRRWVKDGLLYVRKNEASAWTGIPRINPLAE